MDGWHHRLTQIIDNQFNGNATELSRATGIDVNNIHKYTTGKVKSPRGNVLEKIAKAGNVSIEWLTYGSSEDKIKVVGKAGAGVVHYGIDDYAMGDGMFQVDRPFGLTGKAVALIVKGDSMEPALEDGDIIYYQRDGAGVPEECLNKVCVVQVLDGPVYLKKLKKSLVENYFHLVSVNSSTQVLTDQPVEWAAKVLFIKKS